jgi:hypothetical protein
MNVEEKMERERALLPYSTWAIIMIIDSLEHGLAGLMVMTVFATINIC